MQKIKKHRSADCVIGGFRYGERRVAGRKVVGSLLLGLYDKEGFLHHVGFTSALKDSEKPGLTDLLEPAVTEKSFNGNAPGGPSRWSTKRSGEWKPIKPRLVVEVSYDHFTDGRFRHGTTILRWRPDKSPRQCTVEAKIGLARALAPKPDEAARERNAWDVSCPLGTAVERARRAATDRTFEQSFLDRIRIHAPYRHHFGVGGQELGRRCRSALPCSLRFSSDGPRNQCLCGRFSKSQTLKEHPPMAEKKLQELFHETLKDIYYAEKKILSTLPKMAKAAQSQDLKAAFQKHETETEEHVARLEKVFEEIDEVSPRQDLRRDHGHH